MKTPRERYQCDPLFKQLVDVLEYQIQELKLSPTEIREAAMLAVIHYEQKTVRPFFVDPTNPMAILPRDSK